MTPNFNRHDAERLETLDHHVCDKCGAKYPMEMEGQHACRAEDMEYDEF